MVWNIKNKETFTRKATNTVAITPGTVLPIQYYDEAIKNDNVPHNSFTVTNISASCVLFLFLDDYSNILTPDFVVFPNQSITLSAEEGASFTTLWVKNTHAANDVAINELKYRISTVKEAGVI